MPRRRGHHGNRGRFRGHRGCHGGGHGGPGGHRTFASLFQPRPPRQGSHFERVYNLSGLFSYGSSDTDQQDSGAAPVAPAKPQVPKLDESDKNVLTVDQVDFNIASNTKAHHTDLYDMTERKDDPQLVVRRGQPFTLEVQFSRQYNVKEDDLRLVFEIGDNPKASKGTHVEFVLSDKDEAGKWGAKITKQDGKSLTITVFTPPKCLVGKWTFKVDVVKRQDNQTKVFRYTHAKPIYMLFNPWCKEDTVYLEKAIDLESYVLKDDGKVYVGNYKRISGKPWAFAQFSDDVLDCCMYILELSELSMTSRGDPIAVSRKLTAMINSQDEGGVLTGNWSGDYSGGKSPLSWTGSREILNQFYRTKYSVQFGQCWVFSGVLTTVCRALGLPARSVTNFASAHDVDTSITIDYHYDCEGNSLEDEDEDSVWNFHVWNEVWMARPDLPAGYGGWQACDATPQETSDGVYCCGPCPVRAIKEGEVSLGYDGPFIFAEVNADKVHWMQDKDGSSKPVHVEKSGIGKFISTLSTLGDREDVTRLYKYPEDSPEERVAVKRANHTGSCRDDIYCTESKDVEFELFFDADNSFVGLDFVTELRMKNTSKDPRCIYGQLNASTMYYTGVYGENVAKEIINGVMLKPGESKAIEIRVKPEDYHHKLKDCCMLSLSAMAQVVETKQIYTVKDDARLRKPHLNIKAPKTGKVGEEFDVEVSFTNCLPQTLTDCTLEVEGPGLPKAKVFDQGDVLGKGTFLTTIKLKPSKKGKRDIVFIFGSKQLEDINGSHEIDIKA